jgi:hypothetical protein
MKEKILENKFCTYYYDEQNTFITQLWTNESDEMTEDDYKNEMLNYLSFVQKYTTSTVLINLQQFNFTIVPEIQTWVDDNVAVHANKIVEKIAFILPKDLMVELSVEQVMTEEEGKNYKALNYFDTEKLAKEWLLN